MLGVVKSWAVSLSLLKRSCGSFYLNRLSKTLSKKERFIPPKFTFPLTAIGKIRKMKSDYSVTSQRDVNIDQDRESRVVIGGNWIGDR